MTNQPLPEAQWQLLGERIAGWTGLAWDRRRTRELRQALAQACAGLGAADADECAQKLLAGQPSAGSLAVLAQHLTVGETYFFRDPKTMDALAHEVLPSLMQGRAAGRKRLRLWSAGCCTGEEPYSLAILMHRLKAAPVPWEVRILATDINTLFLDKARAGVYGDWSFRGDPYKLRDSWFRPVAGGRHALVERVKDMVDFCADNLALPPAPGQPEGDAGMELILCRNVLMYLSAEAIAHAVARFHRALVPGGWLVVSPSEASDALFPGFMPVNVGSVRFYQKPLPGRQVRSHTTAVTVPRARGAAPAPAKPAQARVPDAVTHGSAPSVQRTAPPDAAAMAASARALADEGRLDEARACCEDWIAAEPLQARARYLHAMVLIEQNELPHAREQLVRALYLDGDFVMAHVALGRLALEAARLPEARRHFTNARLLLLRCPADDAVAEADGLAPAQLLDMLAGLAQAEAPA